MPLEAKMSADVSVIIPAYRAAATIGRALASVAGQTCKPREVIVVDDGSDDGTIEAAEAMAGQINGIALIVLKQDNRGAGAARNCALAEATSTYVAFLDADDEWLGEKIARSMAMLEGSGHVLVGHDYIRVAASGAEQLIECARLFQQADDPLAGLFRRGFIATSSVVVRRDAVAAVGGFDESLATAQDFDLWLKILAMDGASFSIFPEALTRYHVTGGSITSFTVRRTACSLIIAHRHAPTVVDLWFRVLVIHYEALRAYCSSGQCLKAVLSVLALPWDLVKATVASGRPVAFMTPAPGWLALTLWVWVIGAFAAYLYRFQDLVMAALNILVPS